MLSIKKIMLIPATAALLVTAGCAGQGMYYWGDYEPALYGHYETPAESELKIALADIINNAQRRGKKVPPGVRAEYGYLLLGEGDYEAAQTYFVEEKKAWPESSAFMDKMIAAAQAAQTGVTASTEESK